MNRNSKQAFALALLSIATIAASQASFAAGTESGSQATLANPFPVIGGPGATVLTPTGAYTYGYDGLEDRWNPRQKDYSATGVRSVEEAEALAAKNAKGPRAPYVRNYSWGKIGTKSSYNYNKAHRTSMSKFFAKY